MVLIILTGVYTTEMLLKLKDWYIARLKREQFWMAKLDTIKPRGLNRKWELLPPLPFVIQFSDSTEKIVKIIKEAYSKLQYDFQGIFRSKRLITAYRWNKNLKDILVSAAIKDIIPNS